MTKQILIPPPNSDTTEALLQGLIGECHAMIREQVRPSYDACDDPYRRNAYVNAAIGLAETGAKLADAIARLRGGGATGESRQRITVERINRLSPPQGEGG